MNKKILFQASAILGGSLWLLLSGCAGMGGGSGCGGMSGGGSPTGCTGSPPQCASGYVARCQTDNNTGNSGWVCSSK